MGPNYFADEDGIFEIWLVRHDTGAVIRRISESGLEPHEPVDIDVAVYNGGNQ